MKAEIITIGDEILIGQIVDTNSAWLGKQLNQHGIEVYQVTSVHDSREHILKAIAEAEKQANLVLITGGLGPTKDDITKQCLCEYFNTKLIRSEIALAHVTELLSTRGIQVNKLNQDQALVPECCTVLHNAVGTAPGMWFEKNGVVFVSMPGVPYEMISIMEEEVFPRLDKSGRTKAIYHQTVLTAGLPESILAQTIETWEDKLPPFIHLAYLPDLMTVKLRLSAYGENKELLKQEVDTQVIKLKEIISEYIFGYNDDNMAIVVGNLLKQTGHFMATAESCTGGTIAREITAIAGSSAYFKGGVVAYSNDIKENVLGVTAKNLESYGAVSEQVALEMASGVQKLFQCDYAVATTGIAGPDGGTTEKPVGTVWIAVAGRKELFAQKYQFHHNRERNITRSTQTALNMLRTLIIKENGLKDE